MMAKPISEAKRKGIAADLRRGEMTHREVAAKHGVGVRTVDKISASHRDEPASDPVLARLDRLAVSAERALELAEASNDGAKVAAAVRAAHEAIKTVEKIKADVARAGEGGSRDEVERIKEVILTELRNHPDLRRRIAERLLGPVQ